MQIPSIRPHQPPVSTPKPVHAELPPKSTKAEPSAATAALKVGAHAGVQQALNDLPAARPKVVAHGKALVAKTNYPPLEIINALAGLFVNDGKAAPTSSH